jgi:hypothetical protein
MGNARFNSLLQALLDLSFQPAHGSPAQSQIAAAKGKNVTREKAKNAGGSNSDPYARVG